MVPRMMIGTLGRTVASTTPRGACTDHGSCHCSGCRQSLPQNKEMSAAPGIIGRLATVGSWQPIPYSSPYSRDPLKYKLLPGGPEGGVHGATGQGGEIGSGSCPQGYVFLVVSGPGDSVTGVCVPVPTGNAGNSGTGAPGGSGKGTAGGGQGGGDGTGQGRQVSTTTGTAGGDAGVRPGVVGFVNTRGLSEAKQQRARFCKSQGDQVASQCVATQIVAPCETDVRTGLVPWCAMVTGRDPGRESQCFQDLDDGDGHYWDLAMSDPKIRQLITKGATCYGISQCCSVFARTQPMWNQCQDLGNSYTKNCLKGTP